MLLWPPQDEKKIVKSSLKFYEQNKIEEKFHIFTEAFPQKRFFSKVSVVFFWWGDHNLLARILFGRGSKGRRKLKETHPFYFPTHFFFGKQTLLCGYWLLMGLSYLCSLESYYIVNH